MLRPKKILVPVDFSDFSDKAIRYGAEFARSFGSELTLCHILEMPVYPVSVGFGTVPPVMAEDLIPEVKQRIEQVGKAAVGDHPVKYVVREGTPYIEIVDLAKELNIDLIVMPTHGRRGLSHMIIGSTAERVVRIAECPVLVVREHEREFVS